MVRIKKINHIGIVVRDMEKSLSFWSKILGLSATAVERVPSYKVDIAFLRAGESDIELLEPHAGNAPMEKLIRENGGGLDHLCLEVENLEEVLTELKEIGLTLINDSPVVLPGRKIAFVHPSSADGVMLELYELI